jgi:DNA-binding Xre family transcriptional regulator
MEKVRTKIFKKLKELETLKGRDYSDVDIAEITGLSRHTVKSVFSDSVKRIDLATLSSVVHFFRSEGLDVEIADLFVMPGESDSQQLPIKEAIREV